MARSAGFRFIRWAYECDGPQLPSERLVLMALATHANADGISWPRLRSIASRTGLHRDTVKAALRRLEGRGLLRRAWGTIGGERRRIYRLNAPPEAPRGALDEDAIPW
jgi:DNA-binding MarR family transcriptional regulator